MPTAVVAELVMPTLDPDIHRKKGFGPRGWIAGS
jgi:hypothetical protein